MKKLLPLLALAVMSSGLTSCYKERTCTCVSTDSYGTSSYSFTIKSNKPEASLACNAGDNTVTYNGVTESTECGLD